MLPSKTKPVLQVQDSLSIKMCGKTQLCFGSSITSGLLALTEFCGIKEIAGILPSMHGCKWSSLPFPLGKIPKDALAINLAIESLG